MSIPMPLFDPAIHSLTKPPTTEQLLSRPPNWWKPPYPTVYVKARYHQSKWAFIWEVLPESSPPETIYLHTKALIGCYNIKTNDFAYIYYRHGVKRSIDQLTINANKNPNLTIKHQPMLDFYHVQLAAIFATVDTSPPMISQQVPPIKKYL
jgi:hypothetical protein